MSMNPAAARRGIGEFALLEKKHFPCASWNPSKKGGKMSEIRFPKHLVFALVVLFIGSIAITPVLGDKQDQRTFIFKTGDESNPLSLPELMNERNSLVESYKSSAVLKGKGIGLGNPLVPENTSVVAYGFTIDRKGIPHEMIAVSSGKTNSTQLRKRADLWYNENILNPTLDGMAISSEGWPWVGAGEYYYEAYPYGLVEHNWEMYRNTYETDPTKDYFAIKQIWSMDPGFRRWPGSKWLNNRGLSYVDWALINTFGNPALHDRDPLGTKTGPTTVSVSLNPAPSLSWSFPLNAITIYDQSDPVIKRAQWDYAFNTPEVKNTIQGWEPGSSASMNQHSSGQYNLAYLYAQGKFIEPTTWPNYQYCYVYTYWNTWFEYW